VTLFTLPDEPPSIAKIQPLGMFVRDMNFDSRYDFGEAWDDLLARIWQAGSSSPITMRRRTVLRQTGGNNLLTRFQCQSWIISNH
jgi:hypothetical protein